MSLAKKSITTGGCLCGAVRYSVKGLLRDIVNCHCKQCQRLHGHLGAHSKADKDKLTITNDEGLAWYKTSKVARRGFCKHCGSSLFWEPHKLTATGILAGSLDDHTGLKTMGHIFVNEKPTYYEISDDYPQFKGSSEGKLKNDYQ